MCDIFKFSYKTALYGVKNMNPHISDLTHCGRGHLNCLKAVPGVFNNFNPFKTLN